MLRIVEKDCELTADRARGTVVVESDQNGPPFTAAFEELSSADGRNTALAYAAQQGVASPRINGNVIGPYPVNAKGVPLDNVKDGRGTPLPANHLDMQPARYQIAVPVTRPIM